MGTPHSNVAKHDTSEVTVPMTFDALDEDMQMLIVHSVLAGSAPISWRARWLRRVKKLFAKRLTATYYQLDLCRLYLPLLPAAMDQPEELVKLITSIVIDMGHTPDMGEMTWLMPFELYNIAFSVTYNTLHKANQNTEPVHRRIHKALREIARPMLDNARFDRADAREWCIMRICRMMKFVEGRGRRGDPRYVPAFALVPIRARLTGPTPEVDLTAE